MKILLLNDDGYLAQGIVEIEKHLKKFGEVFVVAPSKAMSGTGTAVSVYNPIKFNKLDKHHYVIEGTPSDCAEFGILMLNEKFDFVVSGINNGLNISNDILHSGTIGACLEALSYGVPALAVSHDKNLKVAMEHFDKTLSLVLEKNLLSSTHVVNLNFPNIDEIKGIKIAKVIHRNDKRWYDVNGNMVMANRKIDDSKNYDHESEIYLINHGYITISLLQKDFASAKLYDEYKDIFD